MSQCSLRLQASRLREQRLKESVAFHQFQTDANDMEAWIQEALRQVRHPAGLLHRLTRTLT